MSAIFIRASVPQLQPGEDQVRKLSLTHVMLQESYPSETWTRVYTDGSATDAIADGGAGIFISYTNGHARLVSVATGKHCTNFKAEV